jgi:hypothetical protein
VGGGEASGAGAEDGGRCPLNPSSNNLSALNQKRTEAEDEYSAVAKHLVFHKRCVAVIESSLLKH